MYLQLHTSDLLFLLILKLVSQIIYILVKKWIRGLFIYLEIIVHKPAKNTQWLQTMVYNILPSYYLICNFEGLSVHSLFEK